MAVALDIPEDWLNDKREAWVAENGIGDERAFLRWVCAHLAVTRLHEHPRKHSDFMMHPMEYYVVVESEAEALQLKLTHGL